MLIEIPSVDGLQARLLKREPCQFTADGDHFTCRIRTHVAIGEQTDTPCPLLLDLAHARNKREPLRQSYALRLHFHGEAAAQYLPSQFGNRADERDASGAEQCDPIAYALDALQQMRGQQHGNTL